MDLAGTGQLVGTGDPTVLLGNSCELALCPDQTAAGEFGAIRASLLFGLAACPFPCCGFIIFLGRFLDAVGSNASARGKGASL